MTSPTDVSLRQCASTILTGSAVMLLAWCFCDWIVVRCLPYPDHVRVLDKPMLFGLPLSQFVFSMVRFRKDVLLAIGSTVVACLIFIVLVVFVGVPFHFAIGGSL